MDNNDELHFRFEPDPTELPPEARQLLKTQILADISFLRRQVAFHACFVPIDLHLWFTNILDDDTLLSFSLAVLCMICVFLLVRNIFENIQKIKCLKILLTQI